MPSIGPQRLHAIGREGVVVEVPAGRADAVHRGEHARALGDAGVDGVAQADVDEVVRADVAHRGEAGFERAPGVHGRVHGLLGGKAHQAVVEAAVVVLVELIREVRVRVDEARQQGRIAEIDDARAGGLSAGADRHDAIAAHHHGGAILECGAGGIEHVGGLQHHGFGRGRGLRRLGVRGASAEGGNGDQGRQAKGSHGYFRCDRGGAV